MSDPILLWNQVALEANRISHTNGRGEQAGPPRSARALAIVHLAMYDAYAAVTKNPTMPLYLAGQLPSTDGDESPRAAVAGAAHQALTKLFPSQKPFFDAILAGAGDQGSNGHNFGVQVADAIYADRKNDPGDGSITYAPSLNRGKHRPDPDNAGQGFHAPDYGKLSKGFAIGARHELAAPPFGNATYAKALKEVLAKGIKPELMGTLPSGSPQRDVNETLIGLYWGYDGALELGTPPRLYNQIIREIAIRKGNNPAQNAILFALVNVALADAGILAWDQKYIHNFWRPVVGIREHDQSMGPSPAAVAQNQIDPDCHLSWLPLGAPNTNRVGSKNFTPHFPAYPSGHATFGAAAFQIVRLFYGVPQRYGDETINVPASDDLFDGLSFVSDELNGISIDNTGAVRPRHVRDFPRGLWQMIEENGRSRVYLGVHWVFDAFATTGDDSAIDLYANEDGKPIGGVPLGLVTAEDIFDRFKAAEVGGDPWKSPVGPRTEEEMARLEGLSETYSGSFRPATQAR